MRERPLHEATRRDGIPWVAIQLADGNAWGLACPTARMRPRVTRSLDELGRSVETLFVETEFGYPLEIRRLIDDLRHACDRGTAEQQHEALFRLASALIRRVHEIELEEVADLLDMDLENLPRFVATVLSVVTGECAEVADSLMQ